MPTITTRALTFNFTQSVSEVTGLPAIMEIAVTPLDLGSSASGDATYVGGIQSTTVELSQPVNSVTFDLVPTDSPGLDVPINYRVMWRAGIMERTYTYDFAMPDQDLTWDELTSTVGNIISGESYVQQTDIGVAGGVAGLDQNGIPVTSTGVEVALSTDVTTLQTALATETTAREQAVSALTTSVSTQIANQATTTLASAQTYTDSQISTVSNNVTSEADSRIDGDNALQSQITENLTTLSSDITALTTSTNTNTTALTSKADLVSGVVPLDELPTSTLITRAVTVANQAAMLALTTEEVSPGDLAVRPDGIFVLNAADPTQLSNWVALSIVTSVNGYQGAVSLQASDVNAIAVGDSIAMTQVTGLSTALSALATVTALDALTTTVTDIQDDATLVHTVSGIIPTDLLSPSTVYLNEDSELVTGNNTPIPVVAEESVTSVNDQTGAVELTASDVGAIATGASITQAQVTGLSTTLAAKADLSGGTVPLAELPSFPISQVTGLSTALSNAVQVVDGLIPVDLFPTLPESQITNLSTDLSTLTTAIGTINTALSSKADLVNGVLVDAEIPTDIPMTSVTGLSTALAQCATLTDGAVPLNQMPQNIPQNYISGLGITLANYATLVNGIVPLSQLPLLSLLNVQEVASTTAMTELTTSQVGSGTLCIVTEGVGQGTYVLTGSDPSQLANWTELYSTAGAVTSVNDQTGDVTLTASDVGALATDASIAMTQVTGLSTALNALPTTYATLSQVNALPTTSTFQSLLNTSSFTKRADYVATAAVPSLSGQQTVDGVLVPVGAIVLVTAQANSVNAGLWTVSSSAWTRPVDYVTNSYIAQDTLVMVSNETGSADGADNNYTIWQNTVAGVIDTNATTWNLIGYVAPPFLPVEGNGIGINGSTLSVKVASGGNLQSTSSGLSVDTTHVARWVSQVVPASATAEINHNLDNPFPQVTVWNTLTSPPQLVLAPVQATDANNVTIYFNSTPSANQYWCTVVG